MSEYISLEYLPKDFDLGAFLEGLKVRVQNLGIKRAVVGISGGKDSTIVAELMACVLGPENVYGVLMPCGVQADIDMARKAIDATGINSIELNIGGVVSAFGSMLASAGIEVSTAAGMNIPPRVRMTALYAVAQSLGTGTRVIGTMNASEYYVGWFTKWGDGAADFEPILGYTVSEVRELGHLLGLPSELVLKVPEDGLAEGSDESRLGFTYEELDALIRHGTCGSDEVDEMIQERFEATRHKRTSIPVYDPGVV